MKGFTLLETLIYAVIISVTIALSLGAVYSLIEGSEDLRDKVAGEEEANWLLRKITWALSGASAINTPSSGATSTVLSVNKFNYPQNPVILDLVAGTMRIQKGAGSPTPISGSQVSVSSLVFEHIPASGGAAPAVKASFTAGSNTYGTTIYLRQ